MKHGADDAGTRSDPAGRQGAGPVAARTLGGGKRQLRRELWLLARSVRDFARGFQTFHAAGPGVTIFGSARFGESHPSYAIGRELGRRVATAGFTVITGGGPGLMEAANRGAREAGGASIGCNIRLPLEQEPNPYLDIQVTCQHFFVRKVLLFRYSYAFIALPGGMGTVDELFEALTLIQTRKIEHFPVVLIGCAYWRSIVELLHQMAAHGAIDDADLQLMLVTDDLDEALAYVERHVRERFGAQAIRRTARGFRFLDWIANGRSFGRVKEV
jgi:uncharacterized protein (TIGR00730 family)